jgi:hypothetical protein
VAEQGVLPPGAKYINYEEKLIFKKKLEIAAPVKMSPGETDPLDLSALLFL